MDGNCRENTRRCGSHLVDVVVVVDVPAADATRVGNSNTENCCRCGLTEFWRNRTTPWRHLRMAVVGSSTSWERGNLRRILCVT